MGEDPRHPGDDDRIDDGTKATRAGQGGRVLGAIERLTGTRSHLLLPDAPADASSELRPEGPAAKGAVTDDGRYEVLGEIGQGGMGVVYKARDKDLGRDVALKVLRADLADQEAVVQRFVEEAQVGGQLQHPGIVPIYGLGLEHGRRPYFAMKLVKGETLESLVAGGAKGSELIRVFERVAQTIAYAHSRGVIHRDLKPSNVMVGAFGEVQVLDWGFAKVLGREETRARTGATIVATVRTGAQASHSVAGSIMGTPAYMPPEQAMGQVEELTERSDVFSLGAILCEILTRQPPYTGTMLDQLLAATRARMEEIHGRLDASNAPEALKQLARDCLEPLPKDRPKDAGVVAQRVADHLFSAEERARQAEVDALHAAAQARHVQRGRRTTLALAAVLLVAIVGGGVGLNAWSRTERARANEAAAQVAPLLREATRKEGEGSWAAAKSAAATALALAETGGADAETLATVRALGARIGAEAVAEKAREEEFARETRLLRDLDELRMRRSDLSAQSLEDAYRGAFTAFGVDLDVEGAATALSGFGRPVDLAVHLDAWTRLRFRAKDDRWKTLDRLARALDDDPWRTRLRDNVPAADTAALRDLAAEVDPSAQSTATLARLGDYLRRAGDPEAAVALLRRSLARDPADFWIHYILAQTLWFDLHRASEAMPHALAALALRPQSGNVWNLVGVLRNDGYGDYEGAVRVFRTAVELAPKEALIRANLAYGLRGKGDLDDAIAVCREAIRIDPNFAHGYFELGLEFRDKGDLDGAIAAYREALRVDPKHINARLNIGDALREKGDRVGTLAEFREAVRIDPKSADARSGLGTELRAQGDFDGGIAEIREAIRIDPTFGGAHFDLALALQEKGDFSGAVAENREAARLSPRDYPALENLGVLLCDRLGRYDEAIDVFRRVLRIKPAHAQGCGNLGVAFFKKGEFAAAVEWLRKAKSLDPSLKFVLDLLGKAERFAAARARLPAVLKGEDRPADAPEGLLFADVAFRTGDFASSARFYKEAFATDPGAGSDPRAGYRFRAASSAVLAGPDWYPQALAWLRADLDAWEKAPTSAAADVAKALRRWKDNRDLAPLRDGDDIPAAWHAPWARLDVLLARAKDASK